MFACNFHFCLLDFGSGSYNTFSLVHTPPLSLAQLQKLLIVEWRHVAATFSFFSNTVADILSGRIKAPLCVLILSWYSSLSADECTFGVVSSTLPDSFFAAPCPLWLMILPAADPTHSSVLLLRLILCTN